MSVFLGLDASTSTCGFAFTDENRKILHAGFIDLTKFGTNREKSWAIINRLKTEPLWPMIDRVNLEAALSGFSGPSSRTVVVKLARFSATLQYVLEDTFGLDKLNLINATTARKQLFGKARIKGVKPKEYVRSMMDTLYDTTPWQVKNKIGNTDKRFEDILDSIVISVYAPAK
jgi:hypothetical protein